MTDPADTPAKTLAALDQRAREQRQRLLGRARIAQERLRPANIAHEAGNRVLDLGLDSMEKARGLVRANPLKAAAAALAAGAFLARGPLLRLIGAGFARFRDGSRAGQTAETSED